MFEDGDPSTNALFDDEAEAGETEAVNASRGHSLPEKVFRRGKRKPRYNQRITYARERPRYLFWAKVEAPVLGERCVATVSTANGFWDVCAGRALQPEPSVEGWRVYAVKEHPHRGAALRSRSAGDLVIVSGRMQDVSRKGRVIIAGSVEVLNERPNDWRLPLPKPKARRARILNYDWRQRFASGEIASLWNERPKATASVEREGAGAALAQVGSYRGWL
jgi:hypothetical protein